MRVEANVTRAWRVSLRLLCCAVAVMAVASPVLGAPRAPGRERTAGAQPAFMEVSAVLPATANQLADAMGIPLANVVTASIGTSDPAGVGIGTSPLGRYFPRGGGTFAILSTGLAATAATPNNAPDTSTILTGLKNSQGNDMVQLRIVLAPPPGSQCLSFDFAFFSEEFPEFVGSPFNDAFLAELGGSTFQIVGDTITAPLNFAVDPGGHLISINTVFGVTPNTQSTYDGGTSVLRAVAPLGPSAFPTVELVLTIMDLGDSIYDSAVFLDNFAFSTTACATGTALGDTILSPQSGFITPDQTFDLVLLAPQPITSLTVLVNGANVTNTILSCISGSQPGGGGTIRCPGVSGALLLAALGPVPYVFDVTAHFQDGTSRTESVTYQLLGPSDLTAPKLAILPPSGLFATTQRFDLVLILQSGVTGATITVGGVDVTAPLASCLLANPVGSLALGQALTARCPISGAILGPGPRTFVVHATFSDGTSATDGVIWSVKANSEP